MPNYRLAYLLTYRVVATGDTDAARKVMATLDAAFPSVSFDLRGSQKSGTQAVSGSTTWDVQVVASGVVTAADVASSLTMVTPPAQNLVSSVLLGSVDQRAAGLF